MYSFLKLKNKRPCNITLSSDLLTMPIDESNLFRSFISVNIFLVLVEFESAVIVEGGVHPLRSVSPHEVSPARVPALAPAVISQTMPHCHRKTNMTSQINFINYINLATPAARKKCLLLTSVIITHLTRSVNAKLFLFLVIVLLTWCAHRCLPCSQIKTIALLYPIITNANLLPLSLDYFNGIKSWFFFRICTLLSFT